MRSPAVLRFTGPPTPHDMSAAIKSHIAELFAHALAKVAPDGDAVAKCVARLATEYAAKFARFNGAAEQARRG